MTVLFEFKNKDYIPSNYDDFGFTGENLTASEYAEKMGRFQSERIVQWLSLCASREFRSVRKGYICLFV